MPLASRLLVKNNGRETTGRRSSGRDGRWGGGSNGLFINHQAREGPGFPKPSRLDCAGHRPPTSGQLVGQCTICAVVLLGRTSPDLEISFNRCALSTQTSTHLMLPLHLAPDMQTGVAWANGPVLVGLWPPGPGPGQSKRDGAGMGGLPAAGNQSSHHRPLRPFRLGEFEVPSCTNPPGLPFSFPLHMGRSVDLDA